MPRMRRPLLITSTVAPILASKDGCLKVLAVTKVPSRIVLVFAARAEIVVHASIRGSWGGAILGA